MSVVRRFLVAPSLVRLIRKERGGSRITEGYFAPQAGRTSYVRVDGQHCHLVLVSTAADGTSSEEKTDVPRAHGDALLDVCSGKTAYDRTTVSLGGGRDAWIDRYIAPGPLDIITLAFPSQSEAESFAAPAWFGRDVSADQSYERHAVALKGPPQTGEIPLGNAALEAVLDLIEPRFGFGRYGSAAKPAEEDAAMSALRRIASSAAPAAPAAAMVALAPPPEEGPAFEPAPLPAHEAEPPPEAAIEPEPARATDERPHSDARIDDVIESLSKALGASAHPPQAPARDDDAAAAFERWTVRPRRTQQQT